MGSTIQHESRIFLSPSRKFKPLLTIGTGSRRNAASQRLPTALAGQLIVFVTLAALAYTFALRGQWPEPLTLAGFALLVAGVVGGVRVKAV